MNKIVELSNISFNYGQKGVFSNLSFNIYDKDFLLVIGPNGGGKTTLIKIILGLLQPKSGQVSIYGQSPLKMRSKIGYVPQYTAINLQLPCNVESMLFFALDHRLNKRDKINMVHKILADLGIFDVRKLRFSELSGGLKQRVLLARGLVNKPKLLILDEPTNFIDIQYKQKFCDIISEISSKVNIVMVSHDIAFLPKAVNKIACVENKVVIHDHSSVTLNKQQPFSDHHCLVDHLLNLQHQSTFYHQLLQ